MAFGNAVIAMIERSDRVRNAGAQPV